jgi:hypothetical protein
MVDFINPSDYLEVRHHRKNFENKIQHWCFKNNIGFFGTYQQVSLSKFDKIIKLTIFELIESFEYLCQLDKELYNNGKHLYYLTDNLIDHTKKSFLKNITLIPIPELFGMIPVLDTDQNLIKPTKLFNCFIQRVDSVRQSWFYFLQHYELLDKGYVSFLLWQYPLYSDKTGKDLFDYIHKQYNLYNVPHFDKAYHDLRPLVPYTNLNPGIDLQTYAQDSKYSLILETFATNDDHIGYCYTEKLHRAMQIPTHNLIFSQQNSLTKLANLGFKFSDWMIEIDKLPWIQRQQKLLEILVNDSIAYDAESLYNNALHNKDLIAKYKIQFLNGHCLDKILNEIHNA